MPVDHDKALNKLDHPPSGHNWVRFVQETRPLTTRAMLSFVKGMPRFTYFTGLSAIRDYFLFGINLDAALGITTKKGAPAGRQQNSDLVRAFFEHNKVRRYPVGTCVEFERQWFRISRELLVPISPLLVFRENGKFVPLFVCGWSELALTTMQRRLLMTIYEDAFLSLTDYMGSPAEFLFFPKSHDEEFPRQPETWSRADYAVLSAAELNDHVARYLEAREEVRGILLSAKAADERRQTIEEEKREDDTDDLFDPKDPPGK